MATMSDILQAFGIWFLFACATGFPLARWLGRGALEFNFPKHPGRGLSYVDEPAAVSVCGPHDGQTMPANREGE